MPPFRNTSHRSKRRLDSHLRRLEADRAALAGQPERAQDGWKTTPKSRQQKISKLRDQMLGAKTNEQYRAFQHEITFCEDSIRKAEDRILDLMSEAEPLDTNVKKAEAALKEEKQTVEAEKTRARERTAVDQKQLEQLRGERKSAGGRSEAANLSPLTNAFARNGTARWWPKSRMDAAAPARLCCGRSFSRICATATKLMFCESCGRILHYNPPVSFEQDLAAHQ